jgi:MFS transporter, PAT family, beta-lactamase induction signal transducer AmpG
MSVRRELALLWCLYFVQGLPFGFQATAVPVLLREGGASLVVVSLSGVLALPWLLKPLWAPLVDRYHHPRLGRRRSWLLPMQAGLALTMVVAATSSERLATLVALVLIMNLFAATLDIAVDGLAVDLLRPRDLGHGNAAQVVGYKLGMLTGGGLLLWASGWIGMAGAFGWMAAIVAVVMLITAWFGEPKTGAVSGGEEVSLADILATVRAALAAPGAGALLLAVGTYKLGESMADTMFKPFVLDAGYSKEQVGLWIGTWGMVFSIVGSVLGGWLATRMDFVRAVALTGALRVGPLLGQWWLATQLAPSADAIIAVTSAEHLVGGALTTSMFALMMSRVDPRVGATHFTVLAAVEVLGKAPASWLSGLVAQSFGYARLFALAALLSAVFLLLLWPLDRQRGART